MSKINNKPTVGIIMGSKSDWKGVMEHCSEVLKEFMMAEGFGSEITLDQFNSGDWINNLDQTEFLVTESKTNGNRIAAQEIMEQISSGFGLPLKKEEQI